MSALITGRAGTTQYVSTNGLVISPYATWAEAATNLTQALAASADGSTIIISNGVYRPTATMTIGKSVTITSLYGAAQTVFDGGGQAMSFLFVDNTAVTASIHGLTITNFFSAGIYAANGTLIFAKCNITGNKNNGGRYQGGGINCQNWGARNISLYITNCIIRGNTALPQSLPVQYLETGAGIYYYGNANSTCQVDNCVISDNDAGAGYAGGVWTREGVVKIRNCTIANNTGTGINGANLTANSTIAGNSGGGVKSVTTVENCLVYNNYGPVWGAGIGYSPMVRNCTVVSNYSSQWRPGMYSCSTAINCISISNFNQTGAQNNFELGSMTYSCSSPLYAGAGNIASNPQFMNFAAENFRPIKGSPCINTGTNEDWMLGAADLSGHARIVDHTADMGAYEWFPKCTIFTGK